MYMILINIDCFTHCCYLIKMNEKLDIKQTKNHKKPKELKLSNSHYID